jgi:hypothetical protein
MQVPWRALVIATGRPRHSGWPRCSMEAKKAFISTSAMARGQVTGQSLLSCGHSTLAALLASDLKSVSVGQEWPTQVREPGRIKYCNSIQYPRRCCSRL